MNINKFKGKVVENGLSIEKVARLIGIDKSTLYRKLNAGGNDITIGEMGEMYKILKLTVDEAHDIFFD